MEREDVVDGSSMDLEGPSSPGNARRPVNGGWVLMVAAGLVAAVANYAVLTGEDPTASLAVLRTAAPAGTAVQALDVVVTAVPIDDPQRHLLATVDQLAGMDGVVTATPLEAGVLLRTTDLRIPAGEGLAAMSVPIDPSRAAGGLLVPGDVVDVIADDGGTGADARVAYVVRDVAVLDVLQPGTGVGSSGRSYAVTLSVDPGQAVALATAMRRGELDIVRIAATPGDGP